MTGFGEYCRQIFRDPDPLAGETTNPADGQVTPDDTAHAHSDLVNAMRLLLLVALVLLAGCRAEAVGHASAGDAAPARQKLRPADLAAYRAGRERELEALRGDAEVTPDDLDSLGAAAARLPPPAYRALTAQVDEYLKANSSRFGPIGGRTAPLDSAWLRLDSLRIERMVWIVRIGL